MLQSISKRFKFALRKTTWKKELIGGLVTFFAMLYILPVNSSILSHNNEIIPSYGGVFMATALVSGVGSLIMGMYSNLPIGIAPGMGSNIFFANTMVRQLGMPWQQALSVVFINGLLFVILAVSGLLDKFISSLPKAIKHSFVFALGLYLSYIGFKNSHIIEISKSGLELGNISDPQVIIAIFGMFLVLILYVKKYKMAILITLITMALGGLIVGQISQAANVKNSFNSFTDINWNYSSMSGIGKVFGKGVLAIPGAVRNVKFYAAIIALIFMNLSGASGVIVSAGELAGLEDDNGKIIGTKKGLISIGSASSLSGVLGSSPAGGFLESNAGIIAGARTGISAIVVGLSFFLSIPLFPILQLLFNHSFVTSPILIMVGAMMAQKGKDIEWKDPINGISSFLLITIMLFTNSILNGMAFGIVSYVLLKVVTQKWKEVDKLMYLFFILFLAYIISIPFILK